MPTKFLKLAVIYYLSIIIVINYNLFLKTYMKFYSIAALALVQANEVTDLMTEVDAAFEHVDLMSAIDQGL